MNERAIIEPLTLNCEFSWVPNEGAPAEASDGTQCVSLDAERQVSAAAGSGSEARADAVGSQL